VTFIALILVAADEVRKKRAVRANPKIGQGAVNSGNVSPVSDKADTNLSDCDSCGIIRPDIAKIAF
jgi:hypothetical protein